MIYLIVGVDRHSLAPWHENVAGGDAGAAKQAACAHAQRHGVELAVAAIIGPNSTVLTDPMPDVVARPGATVTSRAA